MKPSLRPKLYGQCRAGLAAAGGGFLICPEMPDVPGWALLVAVMVWSWKSPEKQPDV